MRRSFVLALLLAGCATTRPAPRPPLSLTYLGVAGWSISDGQRVVLLDPYFSRPADPHEAVPDDAAIARHAPTRADAIVVGHAHFDHMLDAPTIARRTGALLIGSAEVVKRARAAGVADDKVVIAQGGEDYALDGFSVRVIPSLHSLIGAVDGDDVQTFAFLVRIAGRQILLFDTANFIERELEGLRPDVVIVATGLRAKIYDYSCRLMRVLGRPGRVYATHFDQWRQPVETPLPADSQADLAHFTEEIHRCAAATAVQVPAPFVPMSLP